MSSIFSDVKIERFGVSQNPLRAVYFSVLSTTWTKFNAGVVVSYILLNMVFACLYLLEPGSVAHIGNFSFFDAFAFSNQTFATIGYGYFLPQTPYAHVIVIIESIVSLVFVALFTGLTFAKFARPQIHVIFSKCIAFVQFEGVPTLMFRMGNGRDSNLIDAQVQVVTLRKKISVEGIEMLRFVDLKLERSRSPFFAISWTVIHKLDNESPFFGMTIEQMQQEKFEIYVSLIGYDEIFAQTVHTGYRYSASQIIPGKKFTDVITSLPDNGRRINFEKFDEIET